MHKGDNPVYVSGGTLVIEEEPRSALKCVNLPDVQPIYRRRPMVETNNLHHHNL